MWHEKHYRGSIPIFRFHFKNRIFIYSESSQISQEETRQQHLKEIQILEVKLADLKTENENLRQQSSTSSAQVS